MQISLTIQDPDTIIQDLRSVARVYRDGETSVYASPVSDRLAKLADQVEREVAAWRDALHRASTMAEPHSRACGIARHEHGPACHANCPSCHGKRITSWPTEAMPTIVDAPLLEAPAPEVYAGIVAEHQELKGQEG